MSTQNGNGRSSFSSSMTSSLAKRHASSSENAGKVTASLAKKRVPLTNITNQKHSSRSSASASSLVVPCSKKVPKAKKTQAAATNVGFSGDVLPSTNVTHSSVLPPKLVSSFPRGDEVALPPPLYSTSMEFSPSKSDGFSVSMDETMSTCDSFKSPEVEYIDSHDVSAMDSIERKTFSNLCISDHVEATGNVCNRDALAKMETDDKIIDVDDNYRDPQLCATFAWDIYKHLLASEVKKRPSIDFMGTIQKDINSSMRATPID